MYERRYTEFMQEMNALNKQLDTLKTIVPEGKEVDEFMRLLQGAATASGVSIRRLTAQAVVAREYHYEMPFNIEVDGPYFSIEDFFSRLSRLSRIINVGDLTFSGLGDGKTKYPVRPSTTVDRQLHRDHVLYDAFGACAGSGCGSAYGSPDGGVPRVQ